jgi:hypothetical protein
MWFRRRYSTARAPFHESNTARIAWRSCSRGSCGKSSDLEHALEAIRQLSQVTGIQLRVARDTAPPLAVLDRLLEQRAVDAPHDVAEHLHEAPVRVPAEALVAGAGDQSLHRAVVEAKIQDRVHHAGHRLARAGAHGDEQRVRGIAQALAGLLLQARQRLVDLLVEAVGNGPALAHVGDACLGRDREAVGHANGAADALHLGDVGTLSPEQIAHLARPLGKVVHPSLHQSPPGRAHRFYCRIRRQPRS